MGGMVGWTKETWTRVGCAGVVAFRAAVMERVRMRLRAAVRVERWGRTDGEVSSIALGSQGVSAIAWFGLSMFPVCSGTSESLCA